MATRKRQSNIHFEVILPTGDDMGLYSWTLYKGKTRIVSEGTAESIQDAREAIAKIKYEKGIVT